MNRRSFVTTLGFSAAALATGLTQAGDLAGASGAATGDLQTAIKAEFGSGFEVLGHATIRGGHCARITHLQNEFLVFSTDLRDWTVLDASIQ